MDYTPYIIGLSVIAGLSFLIGLLLILFSCIQLRANFRLVILGLFSYLLADAVPLILSKLTEKNEVFAAYYTANETWISLLSFLVQALVLAFACYASVKLGSNDRQFQFKHGFAIGAGAATLRVYMVVVRNYLANILLLMGYQSYLGGTEVEGLTESDLAQMESLSAELTARPVIEYVAAFFEMLCIYAVYLGVAYLAASGMKNRSFRPVWISAAVCFAYNGAAAACNSYVSIWLGLAVELVFGALAVLYLRRVKKSDIARY